MTALNEPVPPPGRQLQRLSPSECDRLRAMLAELDAPAAVPRRRAWVRRVIRGIVAVALVALLACGRPTGGDPGRPKCVDDNGHRTTCPEEWRNR